MSVTNRRKVEVPAVAVKLWRAMPLLNVCGALKGQEEGEFGQEYPCPDGRAIGESRARASHEGESDLLRDWE